jgi:ribosomal protein L2
MKHYRPYTKSRRHMTTITYRGKLTTNEPHKALVSGGKRDMGRNKDGRITVRHKGGGHKRLFRDVDFDYNKQVPAVLRLSSTIRTARASSASSSTKTASAATHSSHNR